MLVLSRLVGQSVKIYLDKEKKEVIEVTLKKINKQIGNPNAGYSAQLAFEAPKHIKIYREEIPFIAVPAETN